MPGDPPASLGAPAESSHRRGGAARTPQLPGLVLLTSSLAGNHFSHCGAPRLSRPRPRPGPRGASRPLPAPGTQAGQGWCEVAAPAGLSAGRGCSEQQCRPEASRPEAPRPQPPSARHRAWSLPAGPRRASVPHGGHGNWTRGQTPKPRGSRGVLYRKPRNASQEPARGPRPRTEAGTWLHGLDVKMGHRAGPCLRGPAAQTLVGRNTQTLQTCRGWPTPRALPWSPCSAGQEGRREV